MKKLLIAVIAALAAAGLAIGLAAGASSGTAAMHLHGHQGHADAMHYHARP